MDKTSNVSFHHSYCKYPGNVYLQSILCMHTKRVRSKINISIHHIHCKYPGNIYLRPILCMHTKRNRSNKQHHHPPYSLQISWKYLLTFYFVHAHKANWVKQATSASTIFIANILEISTYKLFCACTQNELDQTGDISIHHIHCKYPGNIYLRPILYIHTKRDKSNKRHHHPSYSLQISWKYLLT